jgi:hypothetical protein
MHYRNGREAKNGDPVVQFTMGGGDTKIVAVGILHNAQAGNDYCNGGIAPTTAAGVSGACLVDCLHADDVAAMLVERGLDKRPAGK